MTNRDLVFRTLDRLHRERGIAIVIHGKARGADTLADEWATANNIPRMPMAADWARHGRSAGPIRNGEMLFHGRPDGVVAFSGGVGTADMVRQARIAGVPVWEIANV